MKRLGNARNREERRGTGVCEDVLEAGIFSECLEKGNVSAKFTGPISESVVSSRTFSMADFDGSIGGGLIRVAGIFEDSRLETLPVYPESKGLCSHYV